MARRAGSRKGWVGGWTRAVVLSASAHLALLAAMVMSLRIVAAPVEAPAIELSLAPADRAPRPPAPTVRTKPPPAVGRQASPPAAVSPAPERPAPPSAITAEPAPPVTPASRGPTLAGALRGSVGCANAGLVGLSAAERRHCAERFAGSAGGGGAAFGVDPAKVALLTKPGPLEGDFLSRMPVKGCRPRAAGDNNGVLPHAQGVTVGITCVIRF